VPEIIFSSDESGIVSLFALTYNGFMELGRDRAVQEILVRLEGTADGEKVVRVKRNGRSQTATGYIVCNLYVT